jgi:DNA-binding IclR family transcriptional regulator
MTEDGAIQETGASPGETVSRAPAVNRAVSLLRVISNAGAPISLNAISRAAGIMPGSCHHVLRALESEGLVRFNQADKRYTLGLGVVVLARQAVEAAIGGASVNAELEAISREFRISVCMMQVLPRDRMMVVAAHQGASPFSILLRIGQRFPAYAGATGRCVVAYSSAKPSELRLKFDKLRWADGPDFETWLAEAQAVRLLGYSVDEAQFMRGRVNISAPITKDGKFVRTLLTTVASQQFDPDTLARLKLSLRDAAARLSD